MSPLNVAVICLSALFASSASAAVYRWTDAQGQVHFSDKPQVQNAKQVQVKTQASSWQPLNIEVIQQGTLKGQEQALDVAKIQRDVNNVYRFYTNVIYFDFYRQVPVKIHLLPDRSEYLKFVRQQMGADASHSLGIYIPALHEIAVYLHEPRYGGIDSTYATIRHEASHAILHSLADILPSWLNEGMSEQMETLHLDNNQLVVTAHAGNRRQVSRVGKNRDILAMTEVQNNQWRHENEQNGINQGLSGQLVYMLLSTTYGRSLVTRLLQDYKRGVNVRSYYLLDEHYIGGAKALKIHWQQWLADEMATPAEICF